MKIETLFTSFIGVDSLLGIPNIDNTAISEVCRLNENKMQTMNLGSGNRSKYFDEDHPAIQPLILEVGVRLNMVYKTYGGFSPKTRLKIDRVWSNINNNTNIDVPHCHRTSFFSAVYYPKATYTIGYGCLNIMTPVSGSAIKIDPDNISDWNSFNSDLHVEYPTTGKLIIFPSWLFHYVSPNTGNDERISIAFDTVVEEYNV